MENPHPSWSSRRRGRRGRTATALVVLPCTRVNLPYGVVLAVICTCRPVCQARVVKRHSPCCGASGVASYSGPWRQVIDPPPRTPLLRADSCSAVAMSSGPQPIEQHRATRRPSSSWKGAVAGVQCPASVTTPSKICRAPPPSSKRHTKRKLLRNTTAKVLCCRH